MTIDYKNGKIYSLRTYNDASLIYIGSTTQSLSKRHYGHKRDYKRYNGTGRYLTSYDVIKCGNTYIELIELYPCETKHNLHAREGYWIRKLDCVNKKCDYGNRTITNNYRISHRDKLREHDCKPSIKVMEDRIQDMETKTK